MLTIEVTESNVCDTQYTVTDDSGVYKVSLWIIVSGDVALAMSDYTCMRRFDSPSDGLWHNAVYGPVVPGLYDHQKRKASGEVIGAPTIENALPRGMADFTDWLKGAKVEHAKLLAFKAKAARIKAVEEAARHPCSKWPGRVPEDQPRLLNCGTYGPNTWRTTGAWLKHALAGAEGGSKGAVKIGPMIVGVTKLRQLATLLRKDVLDITITPASDGGRPTMTITTAYNSLAPIRAHKTHLVYGAFDRYQGENGYSCEIVMSTQLSLPLDDRAHRPGKYNPFTLARK